MDRIWLPLIAGLQLVIIALIATGVGAPDSVYAYNVEDDTGAIADAAERAANYGSQVKQAVELTGVRCRPF